MTAVTSGALVNPRNARTAIKTVTIGAAQYGIFDITMSSSYATGGDTFDFSTIGAVGRQPTAVICGGSAGYTAEYDLTNKKMKAYRQSAATSALTEPNGVNLSSVVFRCVVFW
jgi:SLT domain-containing protein